MKKLTVHFMALLIGMSLAYAVVVNGQSVYAVVCPGTGNSAPDNDVANCPAAPASNSMNAGCVPRSTILGLPTWYRHLEGRTEQVNPNEGATCQVKISGLSDIWKVVAALTEALLRIASLVTIGFIVFGGITYILSQGAPDKTKQALSTIISALVGLVITIIAATVISFIAGSIN